MKSVHTSRKRSRLLSPILLAIALLGIAVPPAAFARSLGTEPPKPSARFDRIWIDYDVTQGNRIGMRIHLKFTVYELKGVDTQIRIKFQDSAGNDLKDTNKSFYTENGNVAVFSDLRPGYEPTDYNDLQIFMPYSEFDITRAGKYDLKMDVDLIYETGVLIQHLTFYDFEYSRGGTSTSQNEVSAKFDSVWIDYNVTENGQLGMRIHTKFTVYNMKGIDGALRIYFQRSDGTSLKSSDGNYESELGNVAAFRDIKPGYEPTVYNDLTTFMPYNEFHLGPGKYNLKMDVDLIDEPGNLLQHLTFYEFVYTKNN